MNPDIDGNIRAEVRTSDPYLKIVALDADGDSIGRSDLVSVGR